MEHKVHWTWTRPEASHLGARADFAITRWMEHWEAPDLITTKEPFKKSLLLAEHWA